MLDKPYPMFTYILFLEEKEMLQIHAVGFDTSSQAKAIISS